MIPLREAHGGSEQRWQVALRICWAISGAKVDLEELVAAPYLDDRAGEFNELDVDIVRALATGF